MNLCPECAARLLPSGSYSLDLVVTHMVDVHVGLKTDDQQRVSLDVTADGEAYLPAWDPEADAVYGGGKGAFRPGLGRCAS